jgi:hypothetical protein
MLYLFLLCYRVRRWLISILIGTSALSVTWIGHSAIAVAKPADVFTPHLDRIRQTLPPHFSLRLPSEILLNDLADEDFISELKVRVYASDTLPGIVVALYGCEDVRQFCLVGMISVTQYWSTIARQEYARHQAIAAPVTLAPSIRGYLLAGSAKSPASGFSTVMWHQEDMIYSLTFAEAERQNLLFMAQSMANGERIGSVNPAILEPPLSTKR